MKAANIGLIILAAGGSQRLGQPKQLLPFEGEPLLVHAIKAGIGAGMNPIMVVLGAHEREIAKEIEAYPVQTVVNAQWQQGMASSIQSGLQALVKDNPDVKAALIMLCDQPYVSAETIHNLISCRQSTGKLIVASSYGDTVGVPALFDKDIFENLLSLKGDQGARVIIGKYMNDVAAVDFPLGGVDIDTEADFEALMNGGNGGWRGRPTTDSLAQSSQDQHHAGLDIE